MRETKQHKIEVHVATICFDGDKVLVAKRADNKKIFPGKWACGGGQVMIGEAFEQAASRKIEQELGVIAEPLRIYKTYKIEVPEDIQKIIPGLRFLMQFKSYVNGDKPTLSESHSEYKWQPVNELDGIDFIPGVKEDIELAYRQMNS